MAYDILGFGVATYNLAPVDRVTSTDYSSSDLLRAFFGPMDAESIFIMLFGLGLAAFALMQTATGTGGGRRREVVTQPTVVDEMAQAVHSGKCTAVHANYHRSRAENARSAQSMYGMEFLWLVVDHQIVVNYVHSP